MKVLYVDLETTGLYDKKLAPTHNAQPYIVQFAAKFVGDGITLHRASYIVQPQDWTIPPEASRIHGIGQDLALAVGVPIAIVLGSYLQMRSRADVICGHNLLQFDLPVLDTAILRSGRVPSHPGPSQFVDTQVQADLIMQLPPTARMVEKGYGHKTKPPKLSEAYKHFIGRDMEDAHDAYADVEACQAVHEAILLYRQNSIKSD